MSDASKRQRDAQVEFLDASFEHLENPPFAFEGQMNALMPEGVSSLEQWGKVVITVPAMKDRNMTFAEAVEIAKSEKKAKNYLNWIVGKFGDEACSSPKSQGVDLAMYLMARGWTSSGGGYQRTYKK